MGRDGLVFVNVRKDIVKLKRKANLAEAGFMEHGKSTSNRWTHCRITGRPLDRPVFCEYGFLYNKDAVIELLIDRKRAEKRARAAERKSERKSSKKKKSKKGRLMLKDTDIPAEIHQNAIHIRDLNDVSELRIKVNPNYRENTAFNTLALGHSNASAIEQGFVKQPKFICPISNYPFNGAKAFFGNWTCGHSVCEAVLKEVESKSEKKQCCICQKPYKPIDLIRLNPIHPEHQKKSMEQFRKKRKQRLLKAKLDKHYKKEMNLLQKREIKVELSSTSSSSEDSDSSSSSSSDDSSNEEDVKPSSSKKQRNSKVQRPTKYDAMKFEDVKTEPIQIDSDRIEVPSSGEEHEEREQRAAEFHNFKENEAKARKKLADIEALIFRRRKRPDKTGNSIVLS